MGGGELEFETLYPLLVVLVGVVVVVGMIVALRVNAFIALITAAVRSGSLQMGDIMQYQIEHGTSLSMILVGIALFLAIVAQLARLPFDMVEADQEIMEGPFIEQSGPKLALFKWAFYAKELIFASLFASIFIPWLHSDYARRDCVRAYERDPYHHARNRDPAKERGKRHSGHRAQYE